MSSRVHRKIDKEEEKRINALWTRIDEPKSDEAISISGTEIFDSSITDKILSEKPLSIIESFQKEDVVLPINCLLYPRTLVLICPRCECNKNPDLIKPYLEREMVVPVLRFPLQDYRTDFADLVIQYPYVGTYTYNFLKEIRHLDEEEICEHCFDKQCERIVKNLSKISSDKKLIDSVRKDLEDSVFPYLFPPLDQERQILKGMEDAVSQKSIEQLFALASKSNVLYKLRAAQAFKAIPEVYRQDLYNIGENMRRMESSIDPKIIEQIEDKGRILRTLNIDYNPKMPVEDYLDIIMPRRKKINSLLNELMSSENKAKHVQKMNDEIWKINEEISSSKAFETLTFLTDFISENANILFGMLMGGLIGYSSASFIGCTLGSIGGLTSGIISKHIPFKLPRYPKRTIEWLKEKIESPEERLLSIMLSKEIKTVQTWILRRKFRKS